MVAEPLCYQIPDFCALMGISRPTVDRLIGDGKILPIKIGKRTLIPRDEALRLINEARSVGRKLAGGAQ